MSSKLSTRVFTAGRYAQARSLLSPGVRLSVPPSVTLVHCIQTAEDIVKLLSRPGSPIILVFFPTPSPGTQFQGEPLQQGRNIHGGKILRFSTEITVYLGNGTS